jgi:c-di-GMP-binding flagellar brake protein YcgR
LEIGQAITLSHDVKERQEFTCKVVGIGEKSFFIDYPVNKITGKTSMFLENTYFTVTYQKENNVILSFPSKVIARKKIANLPVLELKLPKKELIKKIQRRNYLRIDATLDVSVTFSYRNREPFTTTSVDISGGGVAIVIPRNITLLDEDILNVWIVLPFKNKPFQYINATAKIARIIEKDKGPIIASLEFIDIKSQSRDKIIQFCLQKQIEKKVY